MYGPKGFIAIEVKRGKKVHSHDLSGLRSFARDYNEAKKYLFYMGEKEEYHGDVKVLPLEKALKNLKKILTDLTQL